MEKELRYGHVCGLYYTCDKREMPTQMDLLYEWFGDLLITVEKTDGKTKKEPEFNETDMKIHAVRYKNRLYAGGEPAITQLIGRLTGTAKGNREKQRKNAVLIQKHLCRLLSEDHSLIEQLEENIFDKLSAMSEEGFESFAAALIDYILLLADARSDMSDIEKDSEAFPMDDEVFDAVIYNSAYQWQRICLQGLIHSFMWMLIGSLLRNEAGRLVRRYDSSFDSIWKPPGEDETLFSKLDYLFNPQNYELYYDGDDVDSKYPDITWICDACGAVLDEQDGFDDHLGQWKCARCGTLNPIDGDHAYEWEQDARLGINPMGEENMRLAIEKRKAEIEESKG